MAKATSRAPKEGCFESKSCSVKSPKQGTPWSGDDRKDKKPRAAGLQALMSGSDSSGTEWCSSTLSPCVGMYLLEVQERITTSPIPRSSHKMPNPATIVLCSTWPSTVERIRQDICSQGSVILTKIGTLPPHFEFPLTYLIEVHIWGMQVLRPQLSETCHQNRRHSAERPLIGDECGKYSPLECIEIVRVIAKQPTPYTPWHLAGPRMDGVLYTNL